MAWDFPCTSETICWLLIFPTNKSLIETNILHVFMWMSLWIYLYLCSYKHYTAYSPGPPIPRNCRALTRGRLFAHSNTPTLHLHTHPRENAASCILFEPCWRFWWQSAKVGAAQTAAVQGKFQSANWTAWSVYFQRGTQIGLQKCWWYETCFSFLMHRQS